MPGIIVPGLLLSVTRAFLLKMPEDEIINSLESPWIKAAGDETLCTYGIGELAAGTGTGQFLVKKSRAVYAPVSGTG